MRSAFRCAFLVLMLLIAINACAQTEPKGSSGVIAGRVSADGTPVAGITVIVTSGASFQGGVAGRATTDDQGNYRVTGLAAGEYSINPFAPAFYNPLTQFSGPRGKSVSLDDGETVEGIDFKLIRGGVITGRIVDSAGKPVVEERVQIALIDENHNRLPTPMAYNPYTFLTDDRGTYRIYGLEPGRYHVSVGRDVRPGSIRVGGSPRYYPITYYPGVSEESRAESVELAPGGEATVDITLGKTAVGHTARGRVTSSDTGQPVPGVMVALGSRRPDGSIGGTGTSSNSQTDQRGEFRLDGVTQGSYVAFAVPMNDGDFYSDQASFQITEGDVEGLQVIVHQGGSIAGVATIEGSSDPVIAGKLSQVSLMARNQQDPSAGVYMSPRSIAPDGSFKLTGLSPGKFMIYQVNANQSGGLSIARIEQNGVEVTGGIEVGAGEQVSGIHLVLSYGAGLIHGRVKVQGGSLPESSMLTVVARNTGRTGPSSTKGGRVDARGLFVIQGLEDGEYELTLMVMGNFRDRRMQPLRQKVTVSQSAPADAVFVLDLSGQN